MLEFVEGDNALVGLIAANVVMDVPGVQLAGIFEVGFNTTEAEYPIAFSETLDLSSVDTDVDPDGVDQRLFKRR